MARTGTNATGTGVGPVVFDWRYVVAAGVVFGTFFLIADAGEPGVAMALALGTAGLVLLRTDYGTRIAASLTNLAASIGG